MRETRRRFRANARAQVGIPRFSTTMNAMLSSSPNIGWLNSIPYSAFPSGTGRRDCIKKKEGGRQRTAIRITSDTLLIAVAAFKSRVVDLGDDLPDGSSVGPDPGRNAAFSAEELNRNR